MSVINTARDLESLLCDIRTRDLSEKDINAIADTIPTHLLFNAFIRRCAPDAPEVFLADSDARYWRGRNLALLIRAFLAWERLPQLRLGQLIKNARRQAPADVHEGDSSLFYVTNEKLIDQIEAFVTGELARRSPPKPPVVTDADLHSQEGTCLHEGPCARYTPPKE